jgi:hypothetical protein
MRAIALFVVVIASGFEQPRTNPGSDPQGNPVRLAVKTGHVSNYDEARVRPYKLPDPLVRFDGSPVRDATAWRARRGELLEAYATQIYGRVPANAPRVTWRASEALGSGTRIRSIVGTIRQAAGHAAGNAADAPRITLRLHTPINARGRVPVILVVNFGGGRGEGTTRSPAAIAMTEPPVAADIIARGWGYATVGYQDIQPDQADRWREGVIGQTLAPGQTQPAPDEWGTISAWAWGISRIIDYLASDRSIDARRIAVFGHSRLGKTVLWASAQDERIAAVYSSCAGEMGSALARRDWGETVDDMAQNFAWQFAGTFQQWVGRWNDMPVDAHLLIALSAPRPVFITGGTGDQWADPVGEFQAMVAAGPVYRLLGRRDLGVTKLPPLDTPVIGGDLGWHYHTGGHAATLADWQAFLRFLAPHFGAS